MICGYPLLSGQSQTAPKQCHLLRRVGQKASYIIRIWEAMRNCYFPQGTGREDLGGSQCVLPELRLAAVQALDCMAYTDIVKTSRVPWWSHSPATPPPNFSQIMNSQEHKLSHRSVDILIILTRLRPNTFHLCQATLDKSDHDYGSRSITRPTGGQTIVRLPTQSQAD